MVINVTWLRLKSPMVKLWICLHPIQFTNATIHLNVLSHLQDECAHVQLCMLIYVHYNLTPEKKISGGGNTNALIGEALKQIFGQSWDFVPRRGGGGSDQIPTFSNQNHNHTKGWFSWDFVAIYMAGVPQSQPKNHTNNHQKSHQNSPKNRTFSWKNNMLRNALKPPKQ